MKAILKNARQKKGLKLREVAAALGVDQSLISKFESGDRLPTEKQLRELAHILEVSHRTLLVEWLSLKVLAEVKPYSFADEVLQMVQEHLKSYSPRRIPLSERLQILLDEIDILKQELKQLTGKEIWIEVEEIKRPDLDAKLVADGIAKQLERRVPFRRVMKKAIQAALDAGAAGIKVQVSGRIVVAEIART